MAVDFSMGITLEEHRELTADLNHALTDSGCTRLRPWTSIWHQKHGGQVPPHRTSSD